LLADRLLFIWPTSARQRLLDDLIRPQQQRGRDRQRGLGGAGRGGRGRRGGRVGFGVGGAGPSCEVADVRTAVKASSSRTLRTRIPRRDISHTARGLSRSGRMCTSRASSVDALAQHLITAPGALGNPERRMFFQGILTAHPCGHRPHDRDQRRAGDAVTARSMVGRGRPFVYPPDCAVRRVCGGNRRSISASAEPGHSTDGSSPSRRPANSRRGSAGRPQR
jgi:hypothetical protein